MILYYDPSELSATDDVSDISVYDALMARNPSTVHLCRHSPCRLQGHHLHCMAWGTVDTNDRVDFVRLLDAKERCPTCRIICQTALWCATVVRTLWQCFKGFVLCLWRRQCPKVGCKCACPCVCARRRRVRSTPAKVLALGEHPDSEPANDPDKDASQAHLIGC